MARELHDHPIAGIPIVEPDLVPQPGEVLLGYEVVDPAQGDALFVQPQPKRMNKMGWIAVVLGALCFWPAMCVPCCLSCSYSKYQRPVYGKPKLV